jgi:arylsulfatase A-like enzyme
MFMDAQLQSDSDIDEGSLVRYEREIRYIDDVLRRFVGELDGVSDPADTLLVLTSGHGQEFGEHGVSGHGTHLYRESVHVPLMMRGTGVRAAERYNGLVGLLDVFPTVVESLGLPIPASVQGKSIAGSLRAGLPYDVPPRFSEAFPQSFVTADGKKKSWTPRAYAVQDDGYKVVMYEPRGATRRFEAYDLTADPGEKRDLLAGAESLPPWYAHLKDLLVNYPTACAQVAKPPLDAPFIFYDTRVKLQALEAAANPQ